MTPERSELRPYAQLVGEPTQAVVTDSVIDRAVAVYFPRLAAGALAALVGVALVPWMAPVIGVAGLLVGLYPWWLARRRWASKPRPVSPGLDESSSRLPLVTILAPALPETSLAILSFVGAHFTHGGTRFALASEGGGVCGMAVGVAVGRFGEFGWAAVVSTARRLWFGVAR